MSFVIPSLKGFLQPTSAQTLWTPSQLSSNILKLWLDGADANTISLNGSTISQWSDKSGNNIHATQGNASLQPTYSSSYQINSINVPYFSSKLLAFSASILPATGTWSIYTVAQQDANINDLYLFPQGSAGDIGFTRVMSQRLYIGNGAVNLNVGTSTSPRLRRDSRNGDVFSNAVNAGTENTTTVSDVSVQQVNNFLCSKTAAGASYYNGKVAEVVITNFLDSNTTAKVEGYAAWKWGLQADLPANHPYKNSPPTV